MKRAFNDLSKKERLFAEQALLVRVAFGVPAGSTENDAWTPQQGQERFLRGLDILGVRHVLVSQDGKTLSIAVSRKDQEKMAELLRGLAFRSSGGAVARYNFAALSRGGTFINGKNKILKPFSKQRRAVSAMVKGLS